jgi:homoserine kinase type II
MSNINEELSYLETKWPKDLPEGIIHADVFQDNVFFKNNKFSGLIDFYFACNDFFAYDIALTINAWCFDGKAKFKKDKFLNLIQGYESLRPLIEREKIHLSTLLRGAALRILLTRVHDYIFHPDGAYVEPKDPKEYHSILQFHQENNLGKLL